MIDNLKFSQYFVDYDCTYSHDCYCYDICRCKTITNLEINSIDLHSFIECEIYSCGSSIDLFYLVGIAQVLGFYDKWEIEVVPGYYGEEVGDVTFNDPDALKAIIIEAKMIEQSSDYEKINKLLNIKYGLDSREFKLFENNYKSFYILEDIDINELEFENSITCNNDISGVAYIKDNGKFCAIGDIFQDKGQQKVKLLMIN